MGGTAAFHKRTPRAPATTGPTPEVVPCQSVGRRRTPGTGFGEGYVSEAEFLVDIARPDQSRKKKVRRIAYGSAAVVGIMLSTLGLSRLKPAAPTVEGAWIDTVKRGEMLRNVRGLGT